MRDEVGCGDYGGYQSYFGWLDKLLRCLIEGGEEGWEYTRAREAKE